MTRLLTLADVAARLNVSRRTVEREIAAGHIRATRVRSRVFVTERELAAYMAWARKAA